MGTTHLDQLTLSTGPVLPGSIFFTGRWIFCDAVSGSDGNDGTADSPVQTLTQAYSLATEGNNDVVVIVGRSTTSSSTRGTQRLSATLTWAKSATHLIGMCAPTMLAQRARISTATGQTTNINPLISVTAQGCYFGNFSMFQGVGQASTDEQLIDITGQRNYFNNVDFGGMGHANGAARAGSYVINLTGGSENTFENCTIGLDTITRSAANASVKFRSAATRNIFKGCLFPIMTSAATPLLIDANAASSIDRFAWFTDCVFMNAINSTSTALTAVVSFNASQGGTVFLDNCRAVGANDWTATDTATVKITGAVPNGDTSGHAVSADAT